jgi:hypothetical protein
MARVQNVIAADLFGGRFFGDGNRAVEVAGVSRAVGRDFSPCLRLGSGNLRVGMDDTTDRGKSPVKQRVRCQIGRRTQRTLNDLSVKVGKHQVGGLQIFVSTPPSLMATSPLCLSIPLALPKV